MAKELKPTRKHYTGNTIRVYTKEEVSGLADKIGADIPEVWEKWCRSERDDCEDWSDIYASIARYIASETSLCSGGNEQFNLVRQLRRELRFRNGLFIFNRTGG